MRSGRRELSGPRLQVLAADQIERIYLAALEVLERTGMRIHSPEGLRLLAETGATVADGNLARLPAHVVERALRAAPARALLYTRNGQVAVRVENGNVFFGPAGTCPNVYDPYTGERRPAVKQDVVHATRVMDYLPGFDFIMPLGVPSDVPTLFADRHQFEAVLLHTTKPMVASAYTPAGLADIVRMAEAVAGGAEDLRQRPFFSTPIDPTSPLQLSASAAGKLLLVAAKGLPIICNPMPMAGASAPASLAGLLVQALAEGLGTLTLAQASRPGSPFILGGVLSIMDMAKGTIAYGSPELSLLMAAMADVAHYLRIPMYGTAGCSNAKTLDGQAAIEATASILFSALSGGNLVHDVGLLDAGMTISLEYLVLADEIVAFTRRTMAGIEVSEETLAVDVIDRVGPGGHFLADEHTLRHFRQNWVPRYLDRRSYGAWEQCGRPALLDVLNRKVREILEMHQSPPLEAGVVREVRAIVARAEAGVT